MMENNFEEVRKEVDLSIDPDSHILQRQKLILDKTYENKLDTELSYFTKERDLANNNSDEIMRRTKLAAINSDHENRVKRLKEEYDAELKELEGKYEPKYSKPYYFRWIYIGPVSKYDGITNGLDYYIKQDEFDNLSVYQDVKYSKYICKIKYIPEEWTEHKF